MGVKDQPLCATAALAAGSGLCRGCQHRVDALIPVCPCRIWTTASFPNGMRSWSWMRNEGKGGSKEGDGSLRAPGRVGGLHLLLQGQVLGCHQERGDTGPGHPQRSWNGNQKRCWRRDAPPLLPAWWPRHSPLSSLAGSCRLPARCLQFLTAPPPPGGVVFSRWDIQRIREQRILQRLQLRMYKRKGIQESEPEVTSFFPEPDDGECLWHWGAGRGVGGQAGVCCLQRGVQAGAV